MYTTSANFKTYANDPNRSIEFKVLINNVEFGMSEIVDVEIEDSVITEEDFELGGCVTSRMNLTLKTTALIPNNAEMKPYMRYKVGLLLSEWLPLGVFKVDSRGYQNGLWKFTCFDKLIATQKYYESDLLFPNTMYQVMVELMYNLGLTEATGLLASINQAYVISSKPEYGVYTYRDMIKFIASAHGCVAKLNKDGNLEFRKFDVRTTQYTITSDRVNSCEETNPTKTITKLVMNYSSSLEPIIIGEGDDSTTLWLFNPFVDTEEWATTIFNLVNGLTYSPVQGDWVCRPDVETADFIQIQTREDVYDTILLRNVLKFSGGMVAAITSPSSSGQQSEYGFDGTINNQIAEVGKRIGLFASATNTAKKTVKQTVVQIALMPLTTASETDIEFVVTLNGIASVDSILRVSFRIAGSDIGRTMRIPVKAGLVGNFISFSTLRARVPKISDWLFCRMVIDAGNFVIEKEECEFYIYGGNIVSGDVKPILEFEDLVSVPIRIDDNATVLLITPTTRSASDTVDISIGISDGGVVINGV